ALEPDRVVEETTLEQKVHLIANLTVFVVPRYNLLDSDSLGVYVSLLGKLLNAVPKDTLNPPAAQRIRRPSGVPIQPDRPGSDEEDAEGTDTFAAPVVSPVSSHVLPRREQIQLDSRTRKRISGLASADHVSSLLRLPLSPNQLIGFLTTLCAIWPGVGDVVVEAVVRPPRRLASPIPFVLRVEVFRWFIRLQEPELSSLSSSSAALPRRVRVRREYIAQDAYDRLSAVDLREPVRIVFVDRFEMEE
ncbi:hypothetical protein H0H92_012588, partial [Tricholoma furcatifolium]